MKTNSKNIGIALVASVMLLFGCRKEELRPMARPTPVAASSTLDNKDPGSWKISSFHIKEKFNSDETVKFEGWSFRFNDDGTVLASRKEEKVKGHWGIKIQNRKEMMVFDFGGLEPFYELNNYWEVAKKTPQYKLLQDNDDSDGTTGELLFGKL
ncbi:MAG: hypothetical protein JWO44_2110 [Bacteroidetes bacterium]|nr:hypothetical protein [Bacteroidota bacterium]